MKHFRFLSGLIPERKSLERQFVDMLLEDRITEAVELGKKLASTEPVFLVVSCLISFLDCPEDNDRKTSFLMSLTNTKVRSDLLWMLFRKGLLIEELQTYVREVSVKDHLYYIILKETYINGYHKLLNKGDIRSCAEFLLDNIDDWDIYKYALDNNLDLRNRSSLNYEYYLLHKFKEKDRAARLLESRSCFKEIQYITDLAGLEDHPNGTMDCIVKLNRNGFDDVLLENAYNIYKNETTVLSVKMVIAVLVSSKRSELLTLALYLSFLHKDMDPSNYEISLIFTFLCRYFCFYPCVLRMLKEMDVKNIQLSTLSFIWSDVLIVKNIQDENTKNEFLDDFNSSITDIENSIKHFVSAGTVSHVIDVLELRKQFLESVVFREVRENRIIGTNPSNSFLHLLGNRCSYMFEKMTVGRVSRDKTPFLTDHCAFSKEDLLDNRICDIKDEGFRSFFKELVQYQNNFG